MYNRQNLFKVKSLSLCTSILCNHSNWVHPKSLLSPSTLETEPQTKEASQFGFGEECRPPLKIMIWRGLFQGTKLSAKSIVSRLRTHCQVPIRSF